MDAAASQPQLRLLAGGRARRPEWQLSDQTRSAGRAGLADARRMLAAAVPADRALRAAEESIAEVRRVG
ncbi:MAG: hypothetical protein ACOYNI_04895 [Acidimicrobiia bacterium]